MNFKLQQTGTVTRTVEFEIVNEKITTDIDLAAKTRAQTEQGTELEIVLTEAAGEIEVKATVHSTVSIDSTASQEIENAAAAAAAAAVAVAVEAVVIDTGNVT